MDHAPELAPSRTWRDDVYDHLRACGVTVVAYVPDGGHKVLIAKASSDPQVTALALTTEEEGVGILMGADLGGRRGVLLVQSSGVGNCVNAFSVVAGCRFPFLMLVSMRGDHGERNPWQIPMGQAEQPVLQAMGFICLWATAQDEVLEVVRAAANMAFQSGRAVAVLLSQRVIGVKEF